MFNTSCVSSSSFSSKNPIREQARLTNSYGSIGQKSHSSSALFPRNTPTEEIGMEEKISTRCKAETTHFAEIPGEILNHVADFLGYRETMQSLLPTSSNIFLKIMQNEFKMSIQMPMPDGTTWRFERNYQHLKELRLHELERQIKSHFVVQEQYETKFLIASIFAVFITSLLLLFSDSANSRIPRSTDAAFVLKILLNQIVIPGVVGTLFKKAVMEICRRIHASPEQIKEHIEAVRTSECFRLDQVQVVSKMLNEARLKTEKKNHANFLRLYQEKERKLKMRIENAN